MRVKRTPIRRGETPLIHPDVISFWDRDGTLTPFWVEVAGHPNTVMIYAMDELDAWVKAKRWVEGQEDGALDNQN